METHNVALPQEIKHIDSQLRYIQKFMREILYKIEQNQPKELLLINMYKFARYLAFHTVSEIKYAFREIIPYCEQLALNIANEEAFNQLLQYFQRFTFKNFRIINVITVIDEKTNNSFIEEKNKEIQQNEIIRVALKIVKESGSILFSNLWDTLVKQNLFIEENKLLQELEKNSNVEVQYQYDNDGNYIPYLVMWKKHD
jgi:hypothetical protein